MFEKRRAAKAKAQLEEELTPTAEEPPAAEGFGRREGDVPAQESLTLSTLCECGHTRIDHTGLRIETRGRCLECDCEEFRRAGGSREEMIDRVQAAVARVERLQALVALRAAPGNGRRPFAGPPSSRPPRGVRRAGSPRSGPDG